MCPHRPSVNQTLQLPLGHVHNIPDGAWAGNATPKLEFVDHLAHKALGLGFFHW